MKKNILVILLSAALLTGCELDLGFFKIGGDQPKEQETEQKQEENNQNSQENQGENQNSSENQQPGGGEQGGGQQGGGQQNTDPLEQEYVATIQFSGSLFTNYASGAGVQADSEGYPGNETKLQEYCDSKLEYQNLLTSLKCTNLNTAEWNSTVYLCVGTGYYVKDKYKEGTLKWNSGVKIYKVEIKAQAYCTYNDYEHVTMIDSPAHVWIDDKDCSVEATQESELGFKTFSKDYENGVNTFSIKSTGARVLLESITITWRG